MTRRPQTPESRLKSDVLYYLDTLGIYYRRQHSGSVRVKRGVLYLGPEGAADFVVYLKGQMPRHVELKAEGQTTKKERHEAQDAFGVEMKELGHRYRICKTVEEVAQFLGEK